MAVIQTIRNNPWKLMLGSSGTIITIVAALFTLDARYAHAADVDKANTEIKSQIQRSVQTLRKQNLEDKLFELDIRKSQSKSGTLTLIDQAIRDRYQQQLNDLLAQRP